MVSEEMSFEKCERTTDDRGRMKSDPESSPWAYAQVS
jgi:hypothetical protein